MKPTIVFYNTRDTDQSYFSAELGAEYNLIFEAGDLTPENAQLAQDAEVISTHVSSKVTAEVMAAMPKLRHVACRSTGFDHVNLEYANQHGITVSTVPAYGEATVAEYTFLLMMAVARRLMLTAHATQFGPIVPEKLTGHDLNGKTLGVIGTGRIGRHAAGIGKGFGMNVIAHDAFPNEEAAQEIGFEYVTLDELLAQSDYITLHAPATPETHHLLSAKQFAAMKPGAIIVNTARGSLIDTPALTQALQSGHLGGAALDVIEGEEALWQSTQAREAAGIKTLSKMPNVLITAHNAYNSTEALDRIRATTAENIRAWHTSHAQNLAE